MPAAKLGVKPNISDLARQAGGIAWETAKRRLNKAESGAGWADVAKKMKRVKTVAEKVAEHIDKSVDLILDGHDILGMILDQLPPGPHDEQIGGLRPRFDGPVS